MSVTLVRLARAHQFAITTTWTGNTGAGTRDYRSYSRNHEIDALGKSHPILGSSDPAFRGDDSRYNPEQLLVASLSTCHMLWILHLCADAGIVITEYSDAASGTMTLHPDGSGEFARVILKPRMKITDGARMDEAKALHDEAHRMCFIARSVKFPVGHEPVVESEEIKR
ncbi:MAG: OsmC family protein [Acidobacteriota bacterium]|nr:OsmC family protein [Acidobacteriota bacterium]